MVFTHMLSGYQAYDLGETMKKIWLEEYPKEVSAEINVEAYQSLVEIFEESVEQYRHAPAFVNLGVTLTYGELESASRKFASFLQGKLRLQKGARIAIMMPNLLQYPIAVFGILRAGMTVVNVNPLYTPRELKHQLNDSQADAIVIVENFACTLSEVIQQTSVKHVVLTSIGDAFPLVKRCLVNFVVKHIKKMVPAYKLESYYLFNEALKEGEKIDFKHTQVKLDDIAFLQYTGGTTGVAKGAVLLHRNMVANVLQASEWVKPIINKKKDIIITALPLYHIFSLTANCLKVMKNGGLNVLITNPRDMKGFVKTLSQYPFTMITGVNTLFNGLLNTEGFKDLDFSTLKLALGGGMAVQKSVAEEWHQVTGKPIVEAYGLTETSPAVSINPIDLEAYNGTIGLPISSTDVSIRDENGTELDINEPGELYVKGPQVMAGYLNRPEETQKVLSSDGWLATGDVAIINEKGYLKIVDRKKDMILVSGFNVYPNEIEDVVVAHPDVLEVAAIGVPSQSSGEKVKLFVVKKNPALTEESLIDFCKEQLTGYKVPKVVEFRDELPKTNVGKILRRELKNSESHDSEDTKESNT